MKDGKEILEILYKKETEILKNLKLVIKCRKRTDKKGIPKDQLNLIKGFFNTYFKYLTYFCILKFLIILI